MIWHMSVELSGPAGYERQYRTSLLLALILKPTLGVLVIEPEGGEDATLECSLGVFELQSKTSAAEVTEHSIAEWLLHYPRRAEVNSLLERLHNDRARRVIFVTGGRCTDSVREMVTSWSNLTEPGSVRPGMRKTLKSAIEQRLRDLERGPSALARRRGEAGRAFLKTLSARELSVVLGRVRVVEGSLGGDVDDRIRAELVQRYQVAPSNTDSCLRALDEVVRAARGTRSDAWAELRSCLLSFSGTPALPPDVVHVSRPDEDALHRHLKSASVLLLTGQSECGKTRTARRLGEVLRSEGYTYDEDRSLRKATSYLLRAGSDPGVLLIDDPEEFARPGTERHLRDAMEGARAHRLLIVTATTEVVAAVYGTPNSEVWATMGHSWVDLTVKDLEFVRAVWEAYAVARKLPAHERARGRAELRDIGGLPQPGQLADLHYSKGATRWSRVHHDAPAQQALSFSARWIALVLSLGADQALPMPVKALEWLAGVDDRTLPALLERDGVTYFPGASVPPPDFPPWPSCAPDPALSGALAELLAKGWIEDTSRGYRFRHPRYVRAARDIPLLESRWLALARKAVASLHPAGAVIAVARLREAVLDGLVGDGWVDVAQTGLRSLFPRVRDLCARLLLERIDAVHEDAAEDAIQALSRRDEGYELLFHDSGPGTPWWLHGEAWRDPREERNFTSFFSTPPSVLDPLVERLRSVQGVPSTEEAFQLARAAVQGRVELTATELDQLRLHSVEAVVRELATYARVLHKERIERADLPAIFDDHPTVVAAALDAFLARAHEWDDDELEPWLALFKTALATPAVAAAAMGTLGDLAEALEFRLPSPGQAPTAAHFRLWGVLASHWMMGLVTRAGVPRQGRLWLTATAACRHLDSLTVAQITDAWVDFLNRCGSHSPHAIDSYYTGVSELLISRVLAEHRGDRLINLLRSPITALRWVAWGDAVSRWNALSDSERTWIAAALKREDADLEWRRLAVLNSAASTAPFELAFGEGDLPRLDAHQLLTKLSSRFLAAGIRQAFGLQLQGDPSWYAPTKRDRWLQLVVAVTKESDHPLLPLAVDALLSTSEQSEADERLQAWSRCVAGASSEFRMDQLASRLVYWSAVFVHAQFAPYWQTWWATASKRSQRLAALSVVESIEAISWNSDPETVLSDALAHHTWSLLQGDLIAIEYLEQIDSGEVGPEAAAGHLRLARPRSRWVLELLERSGHRALSSLAVSLRKESLRTATTQQKRLRRRWEAELAALSR